MSVFRQTEEWLAQRAAEKLRQIPHPQHAAAIVTVPWPPTANTNVRHASGHHYMTARHRMFRETVCARVVAARIVPVHGRLKVVLHASPPDKRRRDLDNAIKPVLDALEHAGVYANDSQVDDLRIMRTAGAPGTIVVFIEEMREILHPPTKGTK